MWRPWTIAGLLAASVAAFGLASGCGGGDEGAAGSPFPVGEHCEAEPAGGPHNTEVGCDVRCPGGPGCAPSSDPTLYAGAAVEDITPVVDHVVITAPRTNDLHVFKPLAGDKCVAKATCDFTDPRSCPAVDPVNCTFMAGFGVGRFATDVADAATVRCLVLHQGNTKVGLCAIDVIGWFFNEVQRTRELVAAEYPDLADLDYIAVGATHVHQMADVMGQWGPTDGLSGVKKDYNALIRRKTADALRRANQALTAVHVEFGKSQVDGHIPETDPGGHGAAAFVSDVRDPVVIDAELRTIRFVDAETDTTVATLLNFCSHPEVADDKNQLITSDFVHTLRESVEQGLDARAADGSVIYQQEGVGGVAVFFNGALGGQVGPGAIRYIDWEGNEVTDDLERAYNNGQLISAYAHEALRVGVERMETAPLGVRARGLYADVKNGQFHIAIAQQLFDRQGAFYDTTQPLSEDNYPSIESEVFVLDLGPAEFVSLPGELHAELLLATPEGVLSTEAPYPFTPAPFRILNDPDTNPSCTWRTDDPTRCDCSDGYARCDDAPPAIANLRREEVIDTHRDPAARYRWVLGLTPDQLGYIVPEYDHKVDAQNPYFEEATPGDHYEETNGVGFESQRHLVGPLIQLLHSPPVIRR